MKGKVILSSLGLLLVLLTASFMIQDWESNNQQSTQLVIPANSTPDSINSIFRKELGISLMPSVAWWMNVTNVNLNQKIVISVRPETRIWNLIRMIKRYRASSFDWVLRSSGSLEDVLQQIVKLYQENSLNYTWQDSGILTWFYADSTYTKYGLSYPQAHCLFISNTYNLKLNYTPRQWLDRMYHESFETFWNDSRKKAAANLDLEIPEIITLASIVTKESNATAEFGQIASVYKLRLRKGMLLQADPTVVFARGKSGRVLLSDTRINSPYNTYIHAGLPPGPLCIPDNNSIDSVLFGKDYPFLYFCAKPDNSGTHNFSVTLSEHNANAQKYHQWLNSRK